jgi:hypothetical protein
MLDHDQFKVHAAPGQSLDRSPVHPHPPPGDGQLKPLTLAIIALLSSPLFLVGIPLAQLALSRAREHPDQARVAKVLATIALVLSYLGIVLIALLAARQTRH